jgi:hypothetical protein
MSKTRMPQGRKMHAKIPYPFPSLKYKEKAYDNTNYTITGCANIMRRMYQKNLNEEASRYHERHDPCYLLSSEHTQEHALMPCQVPQATTANCHNMSNHINFPNHS